MRHMADALMPLFAKAWGEGWDTGERWGYWINRDNGSNDLSDLEVTANPYRTDVPQKGSK